MIERFRQRSLPTRILMYVAAAALMFALAAGVGATLTLLLQGAGNSPGTAESRSLDKQENATKSQEKDSAAQEEAAPQSKRVEEAAQEEAAPQSKRAEEAARQQNEVEYFGQVGDIQSNGVEISLDSYDKLLRYDILTTDDVAQMQANESALRELISQVDDLNPPQRYMNQYKEFRSAIKQMHEAARLAHSLVANPTAATKAKFDRYDRLVDEADGRLQQSNELLGRNYRTIGDVQEISPL